MIDRVELQNFKAFRKAEFSLGKMNLIVGPNGSGKTSILQALRCICDLRTSPPGQVFAGYRSLFYLMGKNSQSKVIFRWRTTPYSDGVDPWLHLSLTSDEHHGLADYLLSPGGTPDWSLDSRKNPAELRTNSPSNWRTTPPGLLLPTAVLLRLDPRRACRPSAGRQPPALSPSGEGLTAVLAALKLADDEKFTRIEDSLRSVIPSALKIRITRKLVPSEGSLIDPDASQSASSFVEGEALVLETFGRLRVEAEAISDGTISTLAILTAAHRIDGPKLLLVDELERGLHPRALATLVDQLKIAVELMPDLQVVATTHSPYLADCFDASEILVTDFDPEAGASIKHLSDHPDFEKWKSEMAPGEFWTSVGEKWVSSKK